MLDKQIIIHINFQFYQHCPPLDQYPLEQNRHGDLIKSHTVDSYSSLANLVLLLIRKAFSSGYFPGVWAFV